VVISDGVATHFPEAMRLKMAGYREAVSFNNTDDVYKYQSFVTVYSSDKNMN